MAAQKAKTSSFGVDFTPTSVRGLRLGINYYQINYRDRIGLPGNGDPSIILGNASNYSSLIIRNPNSAQLSAALAAAEEGLGLLALDPNFNVIPPIQFDPRTIQVIIDARMRNLSVTDTRGIDFTTQYAFDLAGGKATAAVAGTHIIGLRQQVTATTVPFDAAGTYENPPRWRVRGSLGWQRWGWSTNLFANYTDSYTDNRTVIPVPVASYSTYDLNTSFDFGQHVPGKIWSGMVASASAQNIFNRAPPHTAIILRYADMGFDPTNASPLGRLVGIELTKAW